jgi:outer membrane protein assembly factor BamB
MPLRIIRPAAGAIQLQPLRPSTTTAPTVLLTATLNTNEELERLLDRADQLVASGRSDLAPVLWQRVLDEAGDVLASGAGEAAAETRLHKYEQYRPLREEILRRMVAAGPAALKAYRLQSDGAARGHLADEDRPHETALADVVQRWPLTTVGPAAAFELACLRMEQGDFLAAIRLLPAIEQAPDHALPAAAISVRKSAALARVGAVTAARERLAQDDTVPAEIRTLLEADFNRWTNPTTHRPVLAETTAASPIGDAPLAEAWRETVSYSLKAPPTTAPNTSGTRTTVAVVNGRRVAIRIDASGRVVQPNANDANARDLKPGELVNRWADAKWQPALQTVVVGNRALLKSQDRVICLDVASGKTVWMGRRNTYPHAPLSLQYWQWMMAGASGNTGETTRRPQTLTEITLFGDHVPQLMAVSGDLALNLEGPLAYLTPTPPPKPTPQQAALNPFGAEMPNVDAARRTWLAAYDLATGKLRWHRPPSDGEPAGSIGFVSAPVTLNELLIVAASDGQRLSLLALDRATGQTRWRTALCEQPQTGVSPWAPIGVAVDRSDVFISTGMGVVFIVNGLDGSVRQAVTYPRKLSTGLAAGQTIFDNSGTGSATSRVEVRENRVLPFEASLVVLATDFDHVFAIDRRTAALRWEAPLAPRLRAEPTGQYLGLGGGRLIMSGSSTVRAYDVAGGRIVWETPLSTSYGRGAVTEHAIYVPEEHRILTLDPASGRRLGATPLVLHEGAPVGNLSVIGDRMLVLGAGTASLWTRASATRLEEKTP